MRCVATWLHMHDNDVAPLLHNHDVTNVTLLHFINDDQGYHKSMNLFKDYKDGVMNEFLFLESSCSLRGVLYTV